jgi:hypothetical protein
MGTGHGVYWKYSKHRIFSHATGGIWLIPSLLLDICCCPCSGPLCFALSVGCRPSSSYGCHIHCCTLCACAGITCGASCWCTVLQLLCDLFTRRDEFAIISKNSSHAGCVPFVILIRRLFASLIFYWASTSSLTAWIRRNGDQKLWLISLT